ncbi:MAG: DUF177 domain-containing protein [Pseudomonadota bacterium]
MSGKNGRMEGDAERDPSEVVLPLTHPVDVARLVESDGLTFDLMPEADERSKVAAFLAVDGVRDFSFRGALSSRAGGWSLEGRLTAIIVQTCVVTLEPVESAVDVEVTRLWLPNLDVPEGGDLELDADADSAPEPLSREIDLAVPMLEALALEIDPFPRAADAEHGAKDYAPVGAEPLTQEAMRPFAGLAALKARMAGDRSDPDDDRNGNEES